jgi:hypothetical protein
MALATTIACGVAIAPADAQNTAHGPGDLILTIQNPGGATNPTGISIAVLGATSSVFRDATPGSFTLLTNLAATFTNFGASWADATTLYLGAVNYRGNSDTSSVLLTGDPHRTLYLTKARAGVGTVGELNSSLATIGVGGANGLVSNITVVKNNAEQTPAGAFPVVNLTTATSVVEDQNPFIIPGVQDTAYGGIAGGVQANFGPGTFGSYGAAGTIELALDLYRVQFRDDIVGQYGFGEGTQIPEYLGTLTVAGNGDVGYLKSSIPEPTSVAMLGLAFLGLAGIRRRRPSNANA